MYELGFAVFDEHAALGRIGTYLLGVVLRN